MSMTMEIKFEEAAARSIDRLVDALDRLIEAMREDRGAARNPLYPAFRAKCPACEEIVSFTMACRWMSTISDQ